MIYESLRTKKALDDETEKLVKKALEEFGTRPAGRPYKKIEEHAQIMPSLKTIRKRIASTKSTQKITRAMKMVAGARLVRAQQRIVALRPYAVKTSEVARSVVATIQEAETNERTPHPMLTRRAEQTALVVLLTADRGLCGALNTNANKAAERIWREKEAASIRVHFATVGRKGREYLGRRKANVVQDFPRIYDGLDLDKARSVARWLAVRFEKGEFDSIYLIYNEFKTAITQKVTHLERFPCLWRTRRRAGGERGEREGHRRPGGAHLRAQPGSPPRATPSHVPRDERVSRDARKSGELLRRPDDGDGRGDAQREGYDRAADARVQSRAPSRHHEGADGWIILAAPIALANEEPRHSFIEVNDPAPRRR